jgi:Domain of unknown function (DUF4404)
MPTPSIIDRLREVHTELEGSQRVADSSHVDGLKRQIDAVMLEPEGADYATLRERLAAAYASFEGEYPKVAGAIQGLIAELTAAGL